MRALVSVIGCLTLTSAAFASNSACGVVSTHIPGPETQDYFAISVAEVDGTNLFSNDAGIKLPVGKHVLKVYEMIDSPDVMTDNRHRGYSKTLEINVEPNKVYRLSAKFNRDKRFSREEFWEPTVWKVEDKECKE